MTYDISNVRKTKKSYKVFRELVRSDVALSASQISEKLNTDRSTVSQILSALREANLVIKQRNGLNVNYRVNYEKCLSEIRYYAFKESSAEDVFDFHKDIGQLPDVNTNFEKFDRFYLNYIHNYTTLISESNIDDMLLDNFVEGFLNRFKNSKERPEWVEQMLAMFKGSLTTDYYPSDIIQMTYEDELSDEFDIELDEIENFKED